MWQGHYFGNNYAGAKQDFAVRAGLVSQALIFEQEQLDMIWNRYQRASQQGARAKEGNGLGLSICSEILKRSDAKYGVESVYGEGSCFWFEMKKV